MEIRLRPIWALALMSLLFPWEFAHAKAHCVFFIGDGYLTRASLEIRFLEELKLMKERWKDCASSVTFLSLGKEVKVHDGETYSDLDPAWAGLPATRKNLDDALKVLKERAEAGDEVRLYLGDHGAPEGTASVGDGLVTPAWLKKRIETFSSKGIRVRSFFDHCYAGVMLESFRNRKNFRFAGCALSTTSNRIGYSVRGAFLHEPGSMRSLAAGNQGYCHAGKETCRDDLVNHYVRTSDAFLDDYYRGLKADCDGSCVQSRVQKVWGDERETFRQLAHLDLLEWVKEYQSLLESAPRGLTHSLTRQKETLVPDEISSDAYSICEEEIQSAAIQRLAKTLPPESSFGKKVARRTALYESLVRCAKRKSIDQAKECPDFVAYQEVDREYRQARDDYMAPFRMKDLQFKKIPACLKTWGRIYSTWSVSAVIADLGTRGWQANIAESAREKLKFPTQRAYAILEMIRKDDKKAIEHLRKLRACEAEAI